MKSISNSANILVPYDFSDVADNAILYANEFSKIFKKDVSLLHVVEKGVFTSKSEVQRMEEETMTRLNDVTDNNESNTGTTTSSITKPGNIFEQIGEVGEEINASFFVMGTHGIKGMQSVTGSKALKVITQAKSPFLVVQKKPWNSEGFPNIIVPIDSTPETKQKLRWAVYISRIFKSKLHVTVQTAGDPFIQNKVRNNLNYTTNFLTKEDADFEIHEIDKKADRYKANADIAAQIGADLFLINTDPKTGLRDYVMGPFEQKVIANEGQIPVLCINTVNVYLENSDVFAFGM
jgi:nucleotide-binding universal stress UspA family protein